MEQIRAFIAIELPAEIRTALSKLLSKLKPGHERAVKWVNPEGIHLTLKFLGSTPLEKVSDITLAIKRATEGMAPCTLELQNLGAFPNLRSPRVVWVGVGGDVPNITKAQKRLDEALVPLGFSPEAKGFSPHLTLGRVRDQATSMERGDLGKLLSSTKVNERLAFTVDSVNLMKSTLTPGGPIYDRLASVSLDRYGRKC